MNLKLLAFSKILFAIVFVVSLGFTGYLVANNISQRVIEKSLAKQVISTSTVGKSSQLQKLLNEIVVEQKIPGAVMYITTPKGSWLGASGVNNFGIKTYLYRIARTDNWRSRYRFMAIAIKMVS
ncbi:MAG: hypothetical protein RM022_013710 [Nostoc sp. EfeVER01]|uniref:hypothetical protein n=1 Tax=unclassified Nostoc TaxID=2593658 RepID=UPI002AD1E9EA|nr:MULTISPECIES: hypothetical protein [unclassified Nostoc]MDZ7944169.1 hypothetical protein [Nostoc sp. EfeVER01]MDZ7994155.1 hypothetical protein [Nostoc sp. EspVER01]